MKFLIPDYGTRCENICLKKTTPNPWSICAVDKDNNKYILVDFSSYREAKNTFKTYKDILRFNKLVYLRFGEFYKYKCGDLNERFRTHSAGWHFGEKCD